MIKRYTIQRPNVTTTAIHRACARLHKCYKDTSVFAKFIASTNEIVLDIQEHYLDCDRQIDSHAAMRRLMISLGATFHYNELSE